MNDDKSKQVDELHAHTSQYHAHSGDELNMDMIGDLASKLYAEASGALGQTGAGQYGDTLAGHKLSSQQLQELANAAVPEYSKYTDGYGFLHEATGSMEDYTNPDDFLGPEFMRKLTDPVSDWMPDLFTGNNEDPDAPESRATGAHKADGQESLRPGLSDDFIMTHAQLSRPSDFYFLSNSVPKDAGVSSGTGFDVHEIRKDFPILHQEVHGKPLVWMDNAATTQKPRSVIDAISRYYEHDNSNIHRGAHELAARATDAFEDAREKVRGLLGAGSTDEVVFLRGTTEAINLVAQTYGRKFIGQGDEIIVPTLEHHANIVPWQMLCQETGAMLRVVPISDRGEILLDEYQRLLGPRTRLVVMAHVSNVLGTVVPVAEMTEMAHLHGAHVLVDGAQSVPHFRVNVQNLDSDFYVFSGHKMFGPTGIGVLYGKREILESMPPWQGGGNMINDVSFEKSTYADVPTKFEAGTASIADAVGLGAAIDYVERIGLDNINQYERGLVDYAGQRLAEVPGLRQIGTAPGKASVLSFVMEGKSTEEVGRYLDSEGFAVRSGHHCAIPTMHRFGVTGTVRPSLAFYNTYEEVDKLISAIHKIAGKQVKGDKPRLTNQ